MEKFNQIEYTRLDISKVENNLKTAISSLENATSFEQAENAILEYDKILKTIETVSSTASIRNDINMADSFYEEEVKFYNNALANLMPIFKSFQKALVATTFKEEIAKKFGEIIFAQAEADIKTNTSKNIALVVEESDLVMEYSKIAATASTEFMGKKCNFYGLLKQMESKDREIRKNAFVAWANLYASIADKLDNVYDKLVAIRMKKAETAGFSDFVEFNYLQNHHFDYDKNDVAKFRSNIKKYVTPLCSEIIEAQKKRIGISDFKFYDEKLFFLEGNADPIGNRDELVEKTKKMYGEMSKETKEFFDFMYERDLFDLETKDNKRMGGYCTILPDIEAPFIFSNFNGTAADVEVLTHEAGHCFNMYLSMRQNPLLATVSATNETCEIHSMSMEMLSYPWWESYFGKEVDRAKYAHMAGNILMLPYICCVDEFQQEVFKNPTMTAKERRLTWRNIEKAFMPWRDYDGVEFLEEGGFWMQKQHIFMYPFYYIDYALAQLSSFEIFGKSKINRETAWNDYVKLCALGGSKSYLELLKETNLTSPFEDGFVEKAVSYVKSEVIGKEF